MELFALAASADTKTFVIAVIIGFGIGLAGGMAIAFRKMRKK